MTDTAPAKRGGLSGMLLAELKSMAGGLGIKGTSSMKKAQLVDAIKAAQAGSPSTPPAQARQPAADQSARAPQRTRTQTAQPAEAERPAQSGQAGQSAEAAQAGQAAATGQAEHTGRPDPQREQQAASQQSAQKKARAKQQQQQDQPDQSADSDHSAQHSAQGKQGKAGGQQQAKQGKQDPRHDQKQAQKQAQKQGGQAKHEQAKQDQAKQDQAKQDQAKQDQKQQDQQDADDEGGSRRNRRRRGRDRERTRGGVSGNRENEPQILDDDILVPAAGIVDVLDNYAFVRTSGYLAGTDDVYLAMSLVRRFGLRPGDAVTGQVRQPREGERKEKFNPMVRVDSVNGADPEQTRHRIDFNDLTPLYPQDLLRLETDPTDLTGRVIDLVAPVGKGQRGLIVAGPRSGKTSVIQRIAASVTTNNPECHLMVVLVDERPEEVTEFERSTKGEVIASTFDRPATDHVAVAELAIERAKRLVELGHDVVVLLDGITRLARAYNLVAPSGGRALAAGVDAAALFPPKRFFGAARNIENGGSLTILATAQVESASALDEVIFEEFTGTGNWALRLRQDLADQRLFPAVDLRASGTRREEELLTEQELAVLHKARGRYTEDDAEQGLRTLLDKLRSTRTNVELLMQLR